MLMTKETTTGDPHAARLGDPRAAGGRRHPRMRGARLGEGPGRSARARARLRSSPVRTRRRAFGGGRRGGSPQGPGFDRRHVPGMSGRRLLKRHRSPIEEGSSHARVSRWAMEAGPEATVGPSGECARSWLGDCFFEQIRWLGVYRQERFRSPTAPMRSATMCEKCEMLDEKIAHTRRLAKAGLDDLTLSRFASLIAEYERQKKALHPEA